ncbi:unnamed protein product [Tilletia controversa]|uniref:Uncharacterized protein n=1 Tax=Tilletia controversa TaxID=13291 RepID=A0A8X7SYH0_9BASI|nr:hypothetical protein A4X06_0g3098 [Tilletia controversa]CAD6930513.1 unnamed protein product [Tilletia controversa]CAD6968368.1 unnamed protein product [Tilletia controversa]
MSQAIAEEQQQDPTSLTNKKRRFKPTLSGREVIGSLQAQQPGDAEEEEERFSEDSEDLPPAKEEAPIPKRGRSTRTTANKALRTGDAPPLDWLPTDLGIKIFAAPNPKAKVDKEKKHQQLGAQRMLKLETRTTFAMFKGMLLAVVQEDKKETISGDWDNWLVEVSLHSAGHLFSEKTKLKNEEVFDDFIEAALQSSKRAATVLVKEIEPLFTPAVASGASASSKKDDSRMKNIQDLQHVSDQLRQYDRQVVKRWICNASDCHNRSRAHPSCYIHPRNPQQHVNLKCAHRFAWAAALADSAAGVTVDFPPATEIFMPKAGIIKEEVANEDQAEVSGADEGGKRGSVRRKPLQPMTGPGSSFENSIDLDDYLKVKEEPGLMKVEESHSRDKENQLPAAGPDMDL